MGKIAKLLALAELEPRTITATGLWGDLCENVHLHYRNLRLDFSEFEWASMRAAVNMVGRALEQAADQHDYEEGNPNFLVQAIFDEGVKASSAYYPNRLSIELQRDNTVHVHYRDLRLHLTEPEFIEIATAFERARRRYGEHYERTATAPAHSRVTEPTVMPVPIEDVQPYDAGHLPGVIDSHHRMGIDFCKAGIRKGQRIRPILIDTTGQRKDGFKRYMACVELGMAEIECLVDPNAIMGGQNNQSMFLEEE
jgi:hypothetical protein